MQVRIKINKYGNYELQSRKSSSSIWRVEHISTDKEKSFNALKSFKEYLLKNDEIETIIYEENLNG